MYTLIDDIAIIPGVITVNEKSHCDKRTLLLWRQAGCFAGITAGFYYGRMTWCLHYFSEASVQITVVHLWLNDTYMWLKHGKPTSASALCYDEKRGENGQQPVNRGKHL